MKQVAYFHPALRILHWFMAAAIVAMLFIGIADGFNYFVEACPAGGDPQTAGADDSGSGGGQAMAEVLYLRPFATGFHTGLAAPDSASLTLGVIPHDVPSAPDWLGDAVSGGVPHHPRRRGCFATHCSGE